MKRIPYILSLLVFAGILHSCDEGMNDNQPRRELVKTEVVWNCNRDWVKISKSSSKEYDIQGNLLNYSEFYNNGGLANSSQYSYLLDSSFQEVILYRLDGSVNNIELFSYKYNKDGKIETKIKADSAGNIKFIQNNFYDDNGDLVRKEFEIFEGQSSSSTTYEYQYSGKNLIGKITNPELDGKYESRDSLVYSADYKTIDRYSFNSFGKISTIYTYKYDYSGRLNRVIEKSAAAEIRKRQSYSYTFF
jgi:hypothetical protein